MKLFSVLFETNQAAIEEIKTGIWDTNPQRFLDSLSKTRYSEYLTNYTEDDLKNLKVFKLPNYNIGFALDGDEIVAVHNNEPTVRGIGDMLILAAVKQGGRKLSHFDGYLSGFYEKNGFVEYMRKPFDPSLAKHPIDGNPDVIWRVYRG